MLLGKDPQWGLCAEAMDAVRVYWRPACPQTAPGQSPSGLADHHALRTLLGAIFRPTPAPLCLGHSLRDRQEGMQLSLGEVLSLAACNRLVLGREARAQAFKTARLESPPPIVLVDGLWLKLAVPPGRSPRIAVGENEPCNANSNA